MLGSVLQSLLPRMIGAFASDFTWFQLVPGFGHDGGAAEALGLHSSHDATVILTSWAVVLATLGLAGLARLGLDAARARTGDDRYVPGATLTPLTMMEVLVEALRNIIGGSLSAKDVRFYFPFLGTIFLYILFNNLVGFIPGFPPATENFSTNFAMAASVFLVFFISGLWRNGWSFLKHLAGPRLPIAMAIFITPLILAIETFGLLLRPATLSIRLTANIFADHLVAGIARDIGHGFLGTIGAVVLPIPFYALGLLVCFLQAFVFTLLSTIYISLAVAHTEEHH